jgi:hypothetical protein
MKRLFSNLGELVQCQGSELGVGDWFLIEQTRVDDNKSYWRLKSPFGTKRTCRLCCAMSALRGKAENMCSH